MPKYAQLTAFEPINRGYNTVFRPTKLSIGLVVPIETYAHGAVPSMEDHVERTVLAERLGFSAVWLRDVPYNVPSFGDSGQLYDPFVYLGFLAAQTQSIALGVASIILPLRHPAHVAKAAATADVLSKGRLLLGIASGDRPDEYPAHNIPYDTRGSRFRESYDYIRRMGESWPSFSNDFGASPGNIDMLPKPTAGKLPLLITGHSQQSAEWIAQNGDGWMIYPRSNAAQALIINEWRDRVETFDRPPQPVMQPLYVDLTSNPNSPPEPIHLGLRLGSKHLAAYLKSLEDIGMNHVALNLRFNNRNIEETLREIADEILPSFSAS